VLMLEELGGLGLVSTRFSVDLVRPVTLNHLDIEGKVVRTGRRLQLLEATLLSAGKLAGRASLLRLRPEPVDLPPGTPAPPSPRHGGRLPERRPHRVPGPPGRRGVGAARGDLDVGRRRHRPHPLDAGRPGGTRRCGPAVAGAQPRSRLTGSARPLYTRASRRD